MVANPEKFQLTFLGVPKDDYNNIYINIGNKKIYAVNDVKLLGVTIFLFFIFYSLHTNYKK